MISSGTLIPRRPGVLACRGSFASVGVIFCRFCTAKSAGQERVLCLTVLLRFVLRITRWKSLLIGYLHGMGQTVLPDPTAMPGLSRDESRHWNSLSGA